MCKLQNGEGHNQFVQIMQIHHMVGLSVQIAEYDLTLVQKILGTGVAIKFALIQNDRLDQVFL